MISVGTILRSARESQGRSLAEIAEGLCVTQRYLRAIEKDDLKSLPGTFFYKSFVKQYAAMLGLPEALLQPGVDALTALPEPAIVPGQAPPRESEGAVRDLDPLVKASNRYYFADPRLGVSLIALVGVLLACSGVYAWWSKPPKPSSSASQPAAPVKTISAGSGSAPIVEVTTADDDPSHVILNLSATEKTWISITSEGKQIFSGMLMPSQTKAVTGREAATMKVGNAGGIEVRLNGKNIGPLGGRGEVRTVLCTPDNCEIVQPPVPASGAAPL
ncbi:MAG TPA: RodZ domain-containing protein [Bryobacteraceae bacterium]